jgi:hypothetical protein
VVVAVEECIMVLVVVLVDINMMEQVLLVHHQDHIQ